MDWESVLKKTELPNQECLAQYLSQKGFTPDNLYSLPSYFARPRLCDTPPPVVVATLQEALLTYTDEVPTIEQELERTEKVTEALEAITEAIENGDIPYSVLLTEIDMPGVTDRQLSLLTEAKILEVRQILNDPSVLDQVPGIGAATREKIMSAVDAALNL